MLHLPRLAVSLGAMTFVEEMVVSNFWPLGKYRPEMKLVKMKLPVFGSEKGEFVPYFNLERAEDEMDEDFVSTMEKSTSRLLGRSLTRSTCPTMPLVGLCHS
jgi:hypothetical protein